MLKTAKAAALALLMPIAGQAGAAPLLGQSAGFEQPTVQATQVQYWGRPYRYGYGGWYGPYYRPYYRPYYYAPPPPPPVTYYESRPYVVRPAGDPDAVARCAARFRSFDYRTGTYTTYEGETRLCPYLR